MIIGLFVVALGPFSHCLLIAFLDIGAHFPRDILLDFYTRGLRMSH